MKMVSVRFQEQDLSELHALVNANQLNLSSIIRLIINSFLKQKGGSICLIDKDSMNI
jgi:NADP-dependent 3-hydroxy acid dehydrogenase YdfG